MAEKRIEITDKVMNRVVGWEKNRVKGWFAAMAAAGLLVAVTMIVMAAVAGEKLGKMGTGELLTIFSEDREVIREYGRDVFEVIWWELPTAELMWGLAACGILVGILVYIRRRRKRLLHKWGQVIEYNRQNHG